MANINTRHRGLAQRIGTLIQTSPAIRGTLYLGSAVLVLEGANRLQNHASPYVGELMHLTASPMVIVLTTGYRYLSQRQPNQDQSPTLRRRLSLLGKGFAFGTGSYLVWLTIMAARGWATFPGWGWTMVSSTALAESLLINTIGHLAVSLNEEQVFRGYGFETWRQALGPIGAMIVLVPLFGLAHRPTDLAGVSGYVTMGIVLTGLRIVSGSIWFPVGYHWGWNLIQTGLLGHDQSRPSLIPVHIDGPVAWTGKSSPETGWVTTIINLCLLVAMGIWRWRQSRRSNQESMR